MRCSSSREPRWCVECVWGGGTADSVDLNFSKLSLWIRPRGGGGVTLADCQPRGEDEVRGVVRCGW